MRIGVHKEGGIVIQYGDSLCWARPAPEPPGGWTTEPAFDRFWLTSFNAITGEVEQEWTAEELQTLWEESSESEGDDTRCPSAADTQNPPSDGEEDECPPTRKTITNHVYIRDGSRAPGRPGPLAS